MRNIFDHNSFKDTIIHSYEDIELSLLDNPYYNLMRLIYFGRAKKNIDILILRDPYNMIASRLKGTEIKRDYTVPPRDQWSTFMKDSKDTYMNFYYQDFMAVRNPNVTPIELWFQYAREFMGETNFLSNKICINFNLWFLDSLYRKKIAEKLQITSTDSNLNKISNYGNGSSFDGKLYDQNAQTMKVLERWKHFIDDDNYLSLIKSYQIEYFSKEIFDFTPFEP